MEKDLTKDAVDGIEKGKLRRLTVCNFRCIGPKGVSIDLDDIVVLVGPNNSGKSSILRAYEVAMKDVSNEGKLKLDDFPNSIENADQPVEIELVTEIIEGDPGKQWIGDAEGKPWSAAAGGPRFIRERWVWTAVGVGKRSRWNVQIGGWDDKKLWGFAAVANALRPAAHPVRALEGPRVSPLYINSGNGLVNKIN